MQKQRKSICSDPCNFGSCLLVILGSAAALLGLAWHAEQSNITISGFKHLACPETALRRAPGNWVAIGRKHQETRAYQSCYPPARSTYLVALATRIMPFLPNSLLCWERRTQVSFLILPKLGQAAFLPNQTHTLQNVRCEPTRNFLVLFCFLTSSYFGVMLRKQEAMKEGLYYEIFFITCNFKDMFICVFIYVCGNRFWSSFPHNINFNHHNSL